MMFLTCTHHGHSCPLSGPPLSLVLLPSTSSLIQDGMDRVDVMDAGEGCWLRGAPQRRNYKETPPSVH
jgi:hypothetical protein